MGPVIREADFVQSVADALQFISYYHPADYIEHLGRAYAREQSPAAKDAIAQILTNSRLCAEGKRPICQDTGIVNVFVKAGLNVRWDTKRSLQELVDEGVRRGYWLVENRLRASIVADPLFARKNTGDNTPAVVHVELVAGDTVDVTVAAKGGGSENKSTLAMLNPSDSLVDWVLETVPGMGAGWCPPGMLGIGVGGTADKAMVIAKESLMDPIDMHELLERGPSSKLEELRIEIFEKVNALGIGAQGLGGLTTVLDVKIRTFPTHAASKPVAMIPNCAATRHAHFVLDGSGPVALDPPSLDLWPDVHWKPSAAVAAREPRRADAGGSARLEAGTDAAAVGPDAHGARCGAQAAGGDAELGPRASARRGPARARDLLRRAGGSGAWRSRRARGADHRDAHGQVHRPDARENRSVRDGRQGRARPGRDRIDPQARRRVPDRGRRRGVPRVESDPQGARRCIRGHGHGSDLRIRGRGHAGHGCGGFARGVGARNRAARVGTEDQALKIPVRVA